MSTQPLARQPLTRRQRDAVKALKEHGFLVAIDSWSPGTSSYQPYAFQKRVLVALIVKGLAEPDRQGGVRPVGWAERQAHAENDERDARAQARQERVELLAGDPLLLADAIVTLESRLSRVPSHTHNVGGGVIHRPI